MPVPVASVADHMLHAILSRIAVESPDSGQPELHAGRYSTVPLMSWPRARKVLVPVSEAVTLGEVAVLAGAAAKLLEELQAVTSKAAQASAVRTVQPAACRVLRAFVVNMDSHPLTSAFLSGSVSHLTYDVRRAAMVGGSFTRGGYHGPFGIDINDERQ
jgi:hypothetical protein